MKEEEEEDGEGESKDSNVCKVNKKDKNRQKKTIIKATHNEREKIR